MCDCNTTDLANDNTVYILTVNDTQVRCGWCGDSPEATTKEEAIQILSLEN